VFEGDTKTETFWCEDGLFETRGEKWTPTTFGTWLGSTVGAMPADAIFSCHVNKVKLTMPARRDSAMMLARIVDEESVRCKSFLLLETVTDHTGGQTIREWQWDGSAMKDATTALSREQFLARAANMLCQAVSLDVPGATKVYSLFRTDMHLTVFFLKQHLTDERAVKTACERLPYVLKF
jgi:hypothetical protein